MHRVNSTKALVSAIQCALLSAPLISIAAPTAPADQVFDLGNVVVQGVDTDRQAATELAVGSQDMQRFNRDNVGQAVNMLPGVSLREGGPRNEQTVSVRGFDSRQSPCLSMVFHSMCPTTATWIYRALPPLICRKYA